MKTHKTLLLTALLLGCLTFKGVAQKQVASNDLSAFVGTWEYQQSNEVFRITLAKSKFHSNGSSTDKDCIVGGYYYQKNGVVVANFQNYLPNPVTTTVKIVGFSSSADGVVRNATMLGILFVDDQKEGKTSGVESSFTLLTPTTARWVLEEDEGVYIMNGRTGEFIGATPPPSGFSVPTNVVLTKVVRQPQLPPFNPDRPGNPYDLIR